VIGPSGRRLSAGGIVVEREFVACAALTVLVASLLLAFGPAPGDAAVHLYRTFLVRHGDLVWDNYWYAGHYPLASYSLLYYLPAAVVGNLPLVLAAAVVSTLLFASIARREWGDAALWPSRVFGVCAAAPLFTGLYSYSLGFAAMLATVWALQSRRTWAAVVLAALTLGFSPLAFGFLCLVLLSGLIARRRLTAASAGMAVALVALAGFELLVLHLFPAKGFYPVHAVNLIAMVAVTTLGAMLSRRARGGAVLTAFFVLWCAGGVLASIVASPVGDNWTRLNEFVFPLMLLTASLARFQPRKLAVAALVVALAYNVTPYLLLIPYRLDNRPAAAAYWQPAVTFLQHHSEPGYRVEVVPTAAHWEAYWIPRQGFALARGWYRQLDAVDNPALYAQTLPAATFRQWLRERAVEYVLLPSTHLDAIGAPEEARLLRSGSSGLVVAYHSRDWTIYRLPHPTPLLTGPGHPRVLSFGHTSISAAVSTPGTYLLREHYVPFWQASGSTCVRPAPGRNTYIVTTTAGRFTLTIAPTGRAVLDAAEANTTCPHA